MRDSRKLLVVRRDNIGDLVCTTPLIRALRARFPDAWLGAFVNSYNAPVLDRNPDLDAVYAYTKLKHLDEGQSALRVLTRRLRDFWSLRRMRLDAAILATPTFTRRNLALARSLAPREIVGFSNDGPPARALDMSLPQSAVEGKHEVERVFALGRLLGIEGEIPPLRLVPDPVEVEKARAAIGPHAGSLKVAIHISARRPAQRWPAQKFAELIERLYATRGATGMLLWFPGPADHPRHPGDDQKAEEVARHLNGRAPLVVYRAGPLPELIGALAACDVVVTPDGGAMHLAAALGKPIIALFGDAPAERWHPWGVEHRMLQPSSRTVLDISSEDVLQALGSLVGSGATG